MAYPTLDIIIRNILLKERRPMHYYLEYLVHGKDCLRELNFDVLKNVKTEILKVNSYKAVKWPCDCIDFIKIGIPTGQYVKPLVQYEGISRLNKFDASGHPTLYGTENDMDVLNFAAVNWFLTSVNTNGENVGRFFGLGQGREKDTYKILPERREIQLDEHVEVDSIVVEYITDGMNADAATMIHPYAQATIEAYIKWQVKECNRNIGLQERMIAKRYYEEQLSTLVSRLNPITIEDVKRIFRRSYRSSVKS